MESMDLKQIRCFVAAYEEGSFSKAAKREHCTQPGLSLYIQRLESLLSHRLFERNANGVTPTVAGQHFYASCTEVLKAVTAAKQRMIDMSGSVAGSIKLGVIPSVLKGAVSTMLPQYVADHPYVNVRIVEAYSGSLAEWVAAGEIEAAIVNQPSVHLGLKATHFFRDRLMLVRRAAGNPGKKRPRSRPVPAKELESMQLILPSPKHMLRQVVDNVLRFGSSSKILEIDGMLATLAILHSSDWATIAPSIAVRQDVEQGKLIAQPITRPDLSIDIFLVQTKSTLLSAACRDFLTRVRQAIEGVSYAAVQA